MPFDKIIPAMAGIDRSRVGWVGVDQTGPGWGKPSPYILDGLKHCCVAWAVACSSYQWFKNGSTLYFMVVATHDRLFGGDGRVAEEREKRFHVGPGDLKGRPYIYFFGCS